MPGQTYSFLPKARIPTISKNFSYPIFKWQGDFLQDLPQLGCTVQEARERKKTTEVKWSAVEEGDKVLPCSRWAGFGKTSRLTLGPQVSIINHQHISEYQR